MSCLPSSLSLLQLVYWFFFGKFISAMRFGRSNPLRFRVTCARPALTPFPSHSPDSQTGRIPLLTSERGVFEDLCQMSSSLGWKGRAM